MKTQRWVCTKCTHHFVHHKDQSVAVWIDFVFHKQTKRELALTYERDRRTIKSLLGRYTLPQKVHEPRSIHLLVDALYFGERTELTSWCTVVFRDGDTGENLWWLFTQTETTTAYATGRLRLEHEGYTILSVTGDGFGGIKQAFSGILYQMCQVHMERLVIRGTTRKPKTEAGVALLALARSLPKTDSHTFRTRILAYHRLFASFLSERTIHPDGSSSLSHEDLAKAYRALAGRANDLFIYEHDADIPKTTNSIEGHFSHVRAITEVHRGLSRTMKERVLHSIFLCSTIAPTEEKLREVFG